MDGGLLLRLARNPKPLIRIFRLLGGFVVTGANRIMRFLFEQRMRRDSGAADTTFGLTMQWQWQWQWQWQRKSHNVGEKRKKGKAKELEKRKGRKRRIMKVNVG